MLVAAAADDDFANLTIGVREQDDAVGRGLLADGEGYVTHSNVSAVDEMVNMISASRSYQNNVEVMNTAKTLLLKTLQMGQ